MERLTAADDGREQRQLGVVDAAGRGATFTGSDCHAWAGGRAGDGYAAQGNILVSAATVDALADTFVASAGGRSPNGCSTASPPRRRRAATAAASSQPPCSSSSGTAATPGSRTRSSTSASTTTRGRSRSCSGSTGLHQALFGKTPREDWLVVDDALRAEIDERLAALGHATLDDWAGVENLEERVDGERPDRSGRPRRHCGTRDDATATG